MGRFACVAILGLSALLPAHAGTCGGAAETWTEIPTAGAPSARQLHTAVWTGQELIVWGGSPGTACTSCPALNTGARYDPQANTWMPTSMVGVPSPRVWHAAVWTGTRMIVWGGVAGGDHRGDGASYDPVTDTWEPIATLDAPVARRSFAYAWTGTELVIVGGVHVDADGCENSLQGGGRYNPQTDQWSPIDDCFSCGPRAHGLEHAAVWTGDRVFITGGIRVEEIAVQNCARSLIIPREGWLFDPVTDQWSGTGTGAPEVTGAWSLWSGDQAFVFGSGEFTAPFPIRFDPSGPEWSSIVSHSSGFNLDVVWADDRALLWRAPQISGSWDPLLDAWSDLSPGGAPSEPRLGHTLNWTGSVMLVWGGRSRVDFTTMLNDGGVYKPGQADADGDLMPDHCDPCPFDADNDLDLDGFCGDVDNCPTISNPSQSDTDFDGLGDPCDPCPDDSINDVDGDQLCATQDNCPLSYNPVQADDDGDGSGNVCDLCPAVADPAQQDLDGDGEGDLCDCNSEDPDDRRPGEISDLVVSSLGGGGGISLDWGDVPGANRYSVNRGDLGQLATGGYGQCLASGLEFNSLSVPEDPAPGHGYFFIAQAENFECGLGSQGFDGLENPRVNNDPQACPASVVLDIYPTTEETIYGSVVGSLSGLMDTDDLYTELIEEVISGNPTTRINRLEQRWTFDFVPGSTTELHIEGFQTVSPDGDAFRISRSFDGGQTWTMIPLPNPGEFGFVDPDADVVIPQPIFSGEVIYRVVDSDRTPGSTDADTFFLDELFIRVIDP